MEKNLQIVLSDRVDQLPVTRQSFPDTLDAWAEAYFQFEVTTSRLTQKEQRRDIRLFLEFMEAEEKSLERVRWTPYLSKEFINSLQQTLQDGHRRWSDSTINRIIAHIKTFAKWIYRLRSFPFGYEPMGRIKAIQTSTRLDIDKALTESERRNILEVSDSLLETGGRSKDKNRHRGLGENRMPQRKGYRPYRNRAIIYALVETGMRRGAASNILLDDVDFNNMTIKTIEKGGKLHKYGISQRGMLAIKEYVEMERQLDNDKWNNPYLFLSAGLNNIQGDWKISPRMISKIWDQICKIAEIADRTPHSARHGMGVYIMEKTGNVAAVQRVLGHSNPIFSLEYARIRKDTLQAVLDSR